MDPLTLALKLADTILVFAIKVYDDTPQATRVANADNWGKFIHNIGDFVLSLQGKINTAIK